jgi:hypothetical protein
MINTQYPPVQVEAPPVEMYSRPMHELTQRFTEPAPQLAPSPEKHAFSVLLCLN